tara:strand:- start:3210 stop:3725 length:516 start_codon:yes stop_codon:yes gene_type:complete
MASNQPTQALKVIPSDVINIPEPDAYIIGNNSAGAGTTITDAFANFLGVSNPGNTGYSNKVAIGDVVYHEAAGPVFTLLTVVSIIDNNNIQVSASITGGRYQIYRDNGGDGFLNQEGFSLFVGKTGNISVIPASSGQTVVLKNIPDSSFIPLQVKRVNATSTTATDIIALR